MSVTTQTGSVDVTEFKTEAQSSVVRYTFKTTKKNKTEYVNVSLKPETKMVIKNLVVDHPNWRSDAQFLVDAFIFYLNQDDASEPSAREMVDEASWTSEAQMTASITRSLWEEIDLLVKHSHTPWNTKQEFYICSIEAYKNAGFPPVTQR
jgi:hypothetical protein